MKSKLSLLLLAALILGIGPVHSSPSDGHAHGADSDHEHGSHSSAMKSTDEHSDDHGHDDELKTQITAQAAERAGLKTDSAGPAEIHTTLPVYGQIKLNADRIARAVPRFGGIVREARKSLGDEVMAGEVVAIVESNQTLVSFEVTAPISGLIIDRDVTAGETVGDASPLYTIADLNQVWVDINVPKRDQSKVRLGQTVSIDADNGGSKISGTIAWISPFSSVESQTLLARVVIDNRDRRWRPGLFVKAEITLSKHTVPVAVKESSLQTLDGQTVVFLHRDGIYKAQPVVIGNRSRDYVEITHGLEGGERYVSENSFLIKADLEKSGAEHAH